MYDHVEKYFGLFILFLELLDLGVAKYAHVIHCVDSFDIADLTHMP